MWEDRLFGMKVTENYQCPKFLTKIVTLWLYWGLYTVSCCLCSSPFLRGTAVISCTSASLPHSLVDLSFLPLWGNISSATLRDLYYLPVVFPGGLGRCQSGARRQRAKTFAIDLIHANNACLKRSSIFSGTSSPQRLCTSLVSDL